MRWHRQRYAIKSAEAEELEKLAATIEANTRQTLAQDLHDTTAKDLAHIALLARQLSNQPATATASDLRNLTELASAASQRIRPVILNLDAARVATVGQAISEATFLLSTRGITLAATVIPDNPDAGLADESRKLAGLVIREGTTNILKRTGCRSRGHLAITTIKAQIDPDEYLED